MNTQRQVRAARAGYLVSAALLVILGAVLCWHPVLSTRWLCGMLGGGMMLFGVVKMLGYFSKDLYNLAFQHDLAFGILLLAVGAVLVFGSGTGLRPVAAAVGVAILADGLMKIQTALDARTFGLGLWWLILSAAIAAGTAAVLLLAGLTPVRGAVERRMGAALICDGVLSGVIILTAVKVTQRERK